MSSTDARYWLAGRINPSLLARGMRTCGYGWAPIYDGYWSSWQPGGIEDPLEIRPGVFFFDESTNPNDEDWFLFMPEVERETLE